MGLLEFWMLWVCLANNSMFLVISHQLLVVGAWQRSLCYTFLCLWLKGICSLARVSAVSYSVILMYGGVQRKVILIFFSLTVRKKAFKFSFRIRFLGYFFVTCYNHIKSEIKRFGKFNESICIQGELLISMAKILLLMFFNYQWI